MKIKRPVSEEFRISSPFGERTDPITGSHVKHNGIDFACPVGTEVRAVCDGRIERTGWENDNNHAQGFGFRLWQSFKTESGEKFGVVYGHLSKLIASDSSPIKEGDLIALSGNSGKTSGPHLHIGVRTWDTSTWVPIEV